MEGIPVNGIYYYTYMAALGLPDFDHFFKFFLLCSTQCKNIIINFYFDVVPDKYLRFFLTRWLCLPNPINHLVLPVAVPDI